MDHQTSLINATDDNCLDTDSNINLPSIDKCEIDDNSIADETLSDKGSPVAIPLCATIEIPRGNADRQSPSHDVRGANRTNYDSDTGCYYSESDNETATLFINRIGKRETAKRRRRRRCLVALAVSGVATLCVLSGLLGALLWRLMDAPGTRR